MRIALALCLLGCGSNQRTSHTPDPEPIKMTVTHAAIESTTTATTNDIELVSVEKLPVVRFTKATVLYAGPDQDVTLGVIKKDARAAVLQEVAASGSCTTRWLQIAPRGWTCDTTTEPTTEAPTKARTFSFTDDDPTPPVTGVYGVVRGKDVVAYDSAKDAADGNGRPLVGKN